MAHPLVTSAGLTLLPVDCFSPIAGRRGSVWLDSSLTRGAWGRHSIMATQPVGELRLSEGKGEITDGAGNADPAGADDLLRELESIRRSQNRWAIGFISYEAALPWLRLVPSGKTELPDIHFLIYDRVVTYDNLTGTFSDPELASSWLETDEIPGSPWESPKVQKTVLTPLLSRARYLERVNQIKHHIREGDIYQANLTCRYDVTSGLDPFLAFLRLRRFNPSCYGAYLNFGEYQILSSSPERMFLWEDDRIASSPIKGTIARGHDEEATERNLQALLHSEKDRAELVMIVDLVRNDLGKVARTGSVTVESLYRAEIHSSLIHLVADVSARTRPDCTLGDVLRALFPGGSVTGCPKKRAVELLQQLEVAPRSVYTGCIGYVGFGRSDFNIAIRTMIHRNGSYRIHAGGGIVADSDPESEYEEMLLKAHNLFRTLEVEA